MTKEIETAIIEAEHYALATVSGEGRVNVIPVSMVSVIDGAVWVYDCFMDKTAANVKAEPMVALSSWSGLAGVQIKGAARYHHDDTVYETAVAWLSEQHPDRTLHGVIVIAPSEAYDISAGANAGTPMSV